MKIVLVGASGHGRVALDVANAGRAHEVVGVIDSEREVGSDWLGLEVLGRDDAVEEAAARSGAEGYFVAIGDNYRRAAAADRIRVRCPALQLVSLVHPSATVARDARVGSGVLVAAGAVLSPGVEVEDLAIVNTRASFDHDSRLEAGASLAPGVVTGGNVTIGRLSAIGIGATLVHRVRVGARTVVGAGSLVLGDLPEGVVAYGTPARVVRARAEDDPYL